jgi:hypothetical protein
MLYVPFIIGGLSAGVQVFSDYWFTIGSVLYSISMLIQASHLLIDNHVAFLGRPQEAFRKRLSQT